MTILKAALDSLTARQTRCARKHAVMVGHDPHKPPRLVPSLKALHMAADDTMGVYIRRM